MRLFIVAVLIAAAQTASLGTDKCTWGPSYWCNSLETATTCQALTHCVDTVWTHRLLHAEQTAVCLFSQKLVGTVRHVLSFDNGNAQATHLLASMCTFVKDNTARKECKDMVTGFLPQILTLMESSMEPSSVAAVLGFCKPVDESDSEAPTQEQGPYHPPTDASMCRDCKAFVDDIRTFLNKPQAEEQLTTVTEDIICSDLGDLSFLCKAVVDSAVPKLFKFLVDSDNPEMVCRLSTFCINTESSKPKWDTVFDVVSGLLSDALDDLELDSEDLIPCNECNKVITSVTAYEKDSRFRNDVERAIGFLCSHTNLGEEKCRILSEGLIPQELVSMVSRYLDVKDVCTSALRCSGPGLPPVAPTQSAHFEVLTPVPRDFCTDCLRFFGDVGNVLRNNITVPEATALAKQTVCQKVGPLEFQCNDMLDAAMPSVLHWLAGKDSPASVCTKLTVCDMKTDNLPKFDLVKLLDAAWEEKSLGDFKCDECQALVQDARDADRNPDVQKAVVNFFYEICAQLGQEEAQCKALVDQFAPRLFELIASELEPTVVCELLLRCTKPEYEAKHDEPVPRVVPDTVSIAQDLPSPPRPVKKSKKNSAIYDVQKTVEQKVGESPQCAVCRLVMESIDELIAANSTEQAIEEGLEKVCSILPTSVKDPCDEFIATYTPTLVELLLQQLDPKMICDEMQLCNDTESEPSFVAPVLRAAEEMEEVEEEPHQGQSDSEVTAECELCQMVVGTLDIILKENKTEGAIEQALEDVCDILPSSIKTQCLSFVEEYAVVVVQMIVQELDPQQVCIAIGLCQQAEPAAEVPAVEVSDPLCPICELVVHEIDNMISDNKTEPAIQHALERVCSLFPDTIRAECTSFVDNYAAAVINLLVQEIQPDRICKLLNLCPKDAQAAEAPEPEEVRDDPLCELCQFVIGTVDIIIGSNRSEAAVQSALDKVCNLMPDVLSSECQAFVNAYAPAIIDLLVQEIQPNRTCKLLKLCLSSAGAESPEPAAHSVSADPLCPICQLVVNELAVLIATNKSEMAVEQALEKVCTLFPSDVRAECTSLISLYAPAIINLLMQEVQPKEVCWRLGLCSNSSARVEVTLPEVISPPTDDAECELCKVIIGEINNIIKDNRTEAALIHAVETVCDVVSGDLRLQCKSEVENYGPAVLDLLTQMDDPTQVCKAVRLCTTSNPNVSGDRKKAGVTNGEVSDGEVSDGEVCLICQILANYAGEAANEPSTRDELEKLLKDICTLLPDTLTGTCNSVVEQYTPLILQLLAQKDNPLEVCQELELCPKAEAELQSAVVGVDACTYGPAYWCANMDNARQCGMVEDCVEKYGMSP